jgi:multiple sugar transport system permease protein
MRLLLHTVLVAGSFLFSIPFIWLLSTSAKTPDEMYPPRWLPRVPDGIITSPYMSLRENDWAMRPANINVEDWERVRAAVMPAIKARAESFAGELPAFFAPHLGHGDLSEALFARLARRSPDGLFTKTVAVAEAWFTEQTTPELVLEAFRSVYQRSAVADVAVQGWEALKIERPTNEHGFPWEIVSGGAVMVDRPEGLQRPGREIHYDFAKEDGFVVQGVVPVEMDPAEIKKISVSIHSDRSWHAVNGIIELDGRRYVAEQPHFLAGDLWLEPVWQFPSTRDRGLETKTWIDLRQEGSTDFNEPKAARITLDFRRNTRPWAGFNKLVSNYRGVLVRVPLFMYVSNSLFLVVLNITGQVIGSSLVAFAFSRLQWPGREVCFLAVLATLMIPPQVTMIPVFLIIKHLGWYNTLLPLWVPSFFGSAFFIFLLRQFMRGIPVDLEDSARIDGCGYFGIYWRVVLPLIKPALATIGIFTFMGVWNDFMGPLVYLSDQELYPLSLGLFALQTFSGGNFGLMMAASTLMTLPIILLFFVAQRQFIQGITLTGIKG